ncbi:type 2 lantipeptide synthetase LanM family protein [Micromonospora sp. PLK6-60]|uniref:type 2 lanthipeptide synthetase LanM family protein n=1 Tax=Micromonospora sp. PLK6-60 TaxID=2873383 RepID=UPI001CA715E5|nr:type 2 lanthipeptide synthetase LanM family protein [Micromonospora sp. PLK6-60]MBY8870315.1 type 2 lantipeptide synthetase LanM family protein [Micromonospora sp. PLK6-60]
MSTVPCPADDDPTTRIEERLLAALTITERLAVPHSPAPQAGARSRWRLARWRGGGAFVDDGDWRRRLAAEGLDEPALLALLDESPGRLAARLGRTPEWIDDLVACYRAAPEAGIDPELLPGRPLDASLTLVAPLVARARARVARRARRLAGDAPDLLPADADRLGLTGLLDELVVVLSRAVVLELNIDRLRGTSPGDTPRDRYAAFFRRYRSPEAALALLAEYPVLARQAYDLTRGWADRTIEFLERLGADATTLGVTFHGGARPGRLVDAQETGDPHRDGRRVLVATFDSGLRLVYKPRPVAVEARFQALLAWLNERGTDLHTFAVLPRGGHGWAEYVEARAATTPAGRRRFARRYGSLLALLQAVGATDCHRENVIGHGEHPVLVDLETVFTPAVTRAATAQGGGDAIADSVLAVGLLPRADQAAGPAGERCNCSAWQGEGTDEMRVCAPGHRHDEHGRPDPDGTDPADVAANLPQVLDGFAATYRLLVAVRDELLAPDGPVTAFAADEIRVVLRPTRTYLRLRDAALHTDALQDGLDTERLHDWLWSGVAELPLLAATVAAERADLARRDVPMFTTTVDSGDLWTSRGHRLPGLLARSGLAEARRRLARLDAADLARQRWLVQAAFAAGVDAADAPHARVRWRLAELPPAPVPPSSAYLAAATAVADTVAALAGPGAEPTWFGLTPGAVDPGRWAPAPLGPHLYDGVAGVALFLAHAGRLTGEQRFTDLAERAAAGLAARIADRRIADDRIGAFTGWGGLVHVLGHLGVLWQTGRFAPAVDLALARITTLAAAAQSPDLVDGSAGAVLAVARAGLDPERVGPAVRSAARRLLAAADRYAHPARGGVPLGGLAHGAAGIAAALAHAGAVTGEAGYADAAAPALAYDRSLFRPTEGNWADLRRPGRCAVTWCHGAPGIGLSRLLVRDAVGPDDELDTEIATAVATTLAVGFGRNHSLCHGDLGNLDLLLTAAAPRAVAPAAAVLRDGLTGGWRCANPTALASPELMTGLSGIGLALLRLAAPERVPSVLLLAPPAPAGARARTRTPGARERQWAA